MNTIKNTNLNIVKVTNENVFYSVMKQQINNALDANDFMTTEMLVNNLVMRGFREDLALDTVKFMAFDIEELQIFNIEEGVVLVKKDSDHIQWLERKQDELKKENEKALIDIEF